MYEAEAARERAGFLELGCTPEDADDLVRAGIDPDVVGTFAPNAVAFARAALMHDLPDPNVYLRIAGGDPDRAWREWASASVEGPSDDDEDDEDDEGGKDEESAPVAGGSGEYFGWLTAHVRQTGPGEFSIALIDDLGMPGQATYLDTLGFTLPALVLAGADDQGARVIEAATEKLADYGLVPDSAFTGDGGDFDVVVRCELRAAAWLAAGLPLEERLERLLDALEGFYLEQLSVVGLGEPAGNALVDAPAEPSLDGPDGAEAGAEPASATEWDEVAEFLQVVSTECPATVCVARYQGGYAARTEGWEDLEQHSGLPDLACVRKEAAQRDQELSGFTVAFRSGESVHRHRVRADWVEELEERLDELAELVLAAREEQTVFPGLPEAAERLYEALAGDDRFLAAPRCSPEEDARVADLACSTIGPDWPEESAYVRDAFARARTARDRALTARRQAEQYDCLPATIPAWAAQLAAHPDFPTASTAHRSHSPATSSMPTTPRPTLRNSSVCCARPLPISSPETDPRTAMSRSGSWCCGLLCSLVIEVPGQEQGSITYWCFVCLFPGARRPSHGVRWAAHPWREPLRMPGPTLRFTPGRA